MFHPHKTIQKLLHIDPLNNDTSISDLLNPNERIQSVVARYKNGELNLLYIKRIGNCDYLL